MRHAVALVLMIAVATTARPSSARAPAQLPVPKGGTGPAAMPATMFDPDVLFDQLAAGRETIAIADAAMLRPSLQQYADANKITNGLITRKQFQDFMQSMMQRMQKGGFGGVNGIDAGAPSTQGSQNAEMSPNAPEEETLRAAGLKTDADALLEFFRQCAQPKAEMDQLLALARQLGDANAQIRASAAAKLIAIGPWAVPALRHVGNELDNELASKQARRCLPWVEGPRSKEVPIAAAKLLAVRRPAGAAAVLLAVLPLADDEAVVDALKAALSSVAASPGETDPALLAALQDPLPLRRAVAAEVLARSGHGELLPQVRKVLADPMQLVRLPRRPGPFSVP